MSTTAGDPNLLASATRSVSPNDRFRVVAVPAEWRLAAAARLVGDQAADPLSAAQRFLDSARTLGIDVSLMWATVDPDATQLRQSCLAVVGPGRTAMLFVSGPGRRTRGWLVPGPVPMAYPDYGSPMQALEERVALIDEACRTVGRPDPAAGRPEGARLAQALLEQRERDALAALRAAGFLQLGDLAYMRRPAGAAPVPVPLDETGRLILPEGVEAITVAELAERGVSAAQIDERLMAALERSYIDTKDCPELCGMRTVEDVLASHRAVGVHDPALWWLVTSHGEPEGCMLFSACPDHEAVELVYLGLGPGLRGRRIGAALLALGLHRVSEQGGTPGGRSLVGLGGITCAVDTRNPAAMRLYRAAGFQRFGVRVPLVRAVGEASASSGGV